MSSALVEAPRPDEPVLAQDDLAEERGTDVSLAPPTTQTTSFLQRMEEEATAMSLKIQERLHKGMEKLKKVKAKDKEEPKEEDPEGPRAPGFFRRVEEEMLAVRQKVQEKMAEFRNRRSTEEDKSLKDEDGHDLVLDAETETEENKEDAVKSTETKEEAVQQLKEAKHD